MRLLFENNIYQRKTFLTIGFKWSFFLCLNRDKDDLEKSKRFARHVVECYEEITS